MTTKVDFTIQKYDFNGNVINEFNNLHYAKDLWPIVYILSDGKIKEAYVGETSDAYSRMISHLKNDKKNKLSAVHLILSEKFNKSATLDIESNLIKYMSGDGQFNLLNANVGLANHNYYQKKEVYWEVFRNIWDNLRSKGIATHSLDYIDNSDLFKYSPYKSLSSEQREGLMEIIKNLISGEHTNLIIEGGAGTGKTILAIFLFKLLITDNADFNFEEFGEDEIEFHLLIKELKAKYPAPKMALVVPMSSFRKTLQKVFKNIKGLSSKMVIGPAEVANETFDIVIVDESHRLRRRVNLGAYFGAFDKASEKLGFDKLTHNELDWVLKQSTYSILFYDENQSIKPSDIEKLNFDKLKQNKWSEIQYLKSQFRVKGGNDYVNFISRLLKTQLEEENKFSSKNYEFILFDSIENFVHEIKQRNEEHSLSRMVAGYSWPWISKTDKSKFDINIEGTEIQWNGTNIDWVNSENSVHEAGCIHTTQGYDLNFTGVIFGNEIGYNSETNEIVIYEENYFDKYGKQSIKDPAELKEFILNIYKTILLRGIKGTYIYACNPELRAYFKKYIERFEGEESLISYLENSEVIPYVNSLPLYNLKAAAGEFGEIQNVADFNWIAFPNDIKPSRNFFACQVIGESMNQIIPNGSICLFQKYSGGTRDGKIVLVEQSETQDHYSGSNYTVKEFRSNKKLSDSTWEHKSISLLPRSSDPTFQTITLSDDDLLDFKVIGEFVRVL